LKRRKGCRQRLSKRGKSKRTPSFGPEHGGKNPWKIQARGPESRPIYFVLIYMYLLLMYCRDVLFAEFSDGFGMSVACLIERERD
jgi:hypothetical protein